VDFFKVNLSDRETTRIEVSLQQLDAAPLRPQIAFYDADGARVSSLYFRFAGADLDASEQISGSHDFYFVAISDYLGDVATRVPYIIRVRRIR
jgi:hypothetical protein